jgi:DNA ligase D-like protein (predicted 3'-phosphoesterase)
MNQNIDEIIEDLYSIRNKETSSFSVPGVDFDLAFKLMSTLETGGRSHLKGDSGNSFGQTQVHGPYFMAWLAQNENINKTSLSPMELLKMSKDWKNSLKQIRTSNIWKTVDVNETEIKNFIQQNPKSVVNRKEGTTIRFNPNGNPGVVKVEGKNFIGKELDLNKLQDFGLQITSDVLQELNKITKTYVTDLVVKSAIAKLIMKQNNLESFNKFNKTFSSENIRKAPEIKDLTDWVSKKDFLTKVNGVMSAVEKSGYNTNAPGAFNIYQLIILANANGVGRVQQYLLNKKPFVSGNLTYLSRANPVIEQTTGLSTNVSGDGFSGFGSKLAKLAEFVLNFPVSYANSIRSGERKMTIRLSDIPIEIGKKVKCMSYSGSNICDVVITNKEKMSVTRIEKAFGKKMAIELENKFGKDKQFFVIRFEPEILNADDNGDNKMSEVLIKKDDVELTRGEIKKHYYKPSIRKEIMSYIKSKPILIFLGIGKNKKVLKRNHNNKPIIITNDDEDKKDSPDNYYYWVDKRLLSIHGVFGKTIGFGFVDVDLHSFPFDEAKKYSKDLAIFLNKQLKVKSKIYYSGGSGLHIEFQFDKKRDIDEVRDELKSLLNEFNEDKSYATTSTIKKGIRSDVSTLHNKGSIRIPGSLGEEYGKEKKLLMEQNLEYNFPRNTYYPYDETLPFQNNLLESSYKQNIKVANRNIQFNYIWLWEPKDEKLYYNLNYFNGEEQPEFYDHLQLSKKYGINYNSIEYRGYLYIIDGVPEIHLYSGDFDSIPGKLLKSLSNLSKEQVVKVVEKNVPQGTKNILHKLKEKDRLLEQHMEKRHWMGFNEPDEQFLKSLELKFSNLNVLILSPIKTFFSDEFIKISHELKKNNINFVTASDTSKGSIKSISEINYFLYDVLIVVGNDEKFQPIVKYFNETEKPIVLLSDGVLLGEGIIKNKKIVCKSEYVGKIKRFGGIFSGNCVERDKNIYSALTIDDYCDLVYVLKNASVNEDTNAFFLKNPEFLEDPDDFLKEKADEQDLPKTKEEKHRVDFPEIVQEQQQEEEKEEESVKDDREEKDEWSDEADPYLEALNNDSVPVFGLKLSAPTEKSTGEVYSRWYKEKELKIPNMSPNSKKLFSVENMKDGQALTKLFQNPEAWDELNKNPKLAEEWILPALIMGIGKRWFDNNIGPDKKISGTPFGMFSKDDFQLLEEGGSIEDLPNSQKYISLIYDYITKFANVYFSQGFGSSKYNKEKFGTLPIGGYIYKALHRAMTKEIATDQNYKEYRTPICSYCKNKFKNSFVIPKMKLVGDNPKRWSCPECERQLEDYNNELQAKNEKIEREEDTNSLLKSKFDSIKEQIEEINQKLIDNPNNEELLKQKNELENNHKEIFSRYYKNFVKIGEIKNKRNNIEKTIYSLSVQTNVPFWHTWCPSPTCPGNRVPLTSIDWNADFWKTEKGQIAEQEMKKRFGVLNPNTQYAEEEIKHKQHSQRHTPPEWMMNIPFVCPHDYVKFTLETATNKGAENKGGFLWEPWQKSLWEPKASEESLSSPGFEDKIGVLGDQEKIEESNVVRAICGGLGELASQLFIKQNIEHDENIENWLDKEIETQFGKNLNPKKFNDIVEKLKKSQIYSAKMRDSLLYKQVSNLSKIDPEIFVSWLTSVPMEKEYIKNPNGEIVEQNIPSNVKQNIMNLSYSSKKENIYSPMINGFFNDVVSEQNGFDKYNLKNVLVNTELDGIYSTNAGTFFIAKVNDTFTEAEESSIIGFDSNLKVKQNEVKQRESLKKEDREFTMDEKISNPTRQKAKNNPWFGKILGVWKLNDSNLKTLIPNVLSGMIPLQPNHQLVKYAKQNGDLNLVGEIGNCDLNRVSFDTSSTSFSKGEYILVQAYLIPSSPDSELIKSVRSIRKLTDTKGFIFRKLGQFINKATSSEDSETKDLLKTFFEDIQDYKDDPEEMQNIITDLIQQFSVLNIIENDNKIIFDYINDFNAGEKSLNKMEISDLIDKLSFYNLLSEVGKEKIKQYFNEFFSSVYEFLDDEEEVKENLIKFWNKVKELYKKPIYRKAFLLFSNTEYDKKRNFKKTKEPKMKLYKGKNKYRFVIQDHIADRAGRHFDLRLENDNGTMSSWAIPKHKLPQGKERLLAIKTEDHPVSYNKFEGKIEDGYGKGIVKIHKSGTYKEIENKKNKIIFEIDNKTYQLININNKRWLIMKRVGD